MELESEDKILRLWTPIVLRVSVIASTIALSAGLILEALRSPAYYVARIQELQQGARPPGQESASNIIGNALRGHPHEILTIGLLLLTLVPLGRVALSLCLFIKERDMPYVAFTGYVLGMLVLGVLLGEIG